MTKVAVHTVTCTEKQGKISFLRKVGYGCGELGSSLSWTMISSYLTVFYTDVVGLTPLIISAIMLGARIWDAVNDPMFGAIAETTESKWGRFRPYIIYGAPVLALFGSLTFLNLDIPMFWKIVWCTFTYVGCGMAYTAVNISVGSFANSITANNDERVQLNAFRGAMGSVAGVLMSAVTMPLILFFGNGSTSSGNGYFWAAVIFSIISIPAFWICAFSNKEAIGGDGKAHTVGDTMRRLWGAFRTIIINRDAMCVVAAMFLFLTGVFGRLGIMAYQFIYVLKNPMAMGYFAVALQFGMGLVNLYAPFLLSRVDKKICGALSSAAQVICCVLFFIFGQQGNVMASVIVGFFYGFTNLGGLVSYGLCGEIIDDSWLKTGVRFDGVIYSVISFSTKLGNAIGGSIGIVILAAVGFVANSEMSNEVLTRMNAVINFGPALFFALAIVPFLMISMTNAKGRENEKLIAEKQQ